MNHKRKDRFNNKKHVINIHINSGLLYAERTIWSQRFKAWTRYYVPKPRLPKEEDSHVRWVDNSDNCPKSFSGFTGKHNDIIFQALNIIGDTFESTKNFPELLTICGPPGSGKSAIAKVFTQRMIDELNLNNNQTSKWCLIVDASKFTKDFNPLWIKITKFAETPFERFITTKFRLLVMDNFDSIPPSSQQQLKRVMEAFALKLKYIFVTGDPKTTMIGYITAKSTTLRTKTINEKDALLVVLSVASRNHIGYDRDGIHELFLLNENRNLSSILDLMQKVFLQEHFCSRENVRKISGGAKDLPVLTPTQAVEPMERCKICTLHPPCNHMSLEKLTALGISRRKELPRYKTGSMSCPEFVRYGRCSIFNKHGHCSLDHPKNIHIIEAPMRRCPQCTIPWPCGHCAFTAERLKLKATIEEVQIRIRRLKQINVPEPPMALVKHLESHENWRQHIAKIELAYLTTNNTTLLKLAEEWLETRCSINKDEYSRRTRQLVEGFGELYRTDMLLDAASVLAAGNQSNDENGVT